MSEFVFYSFRSAFDAQRGRRLSLQEWLDRFHSGKSITVTEHPTVDYKEIPEDVLAVISADIVLLAAQGRTVVLMDSGGMERTGAVCRHMAAKEDSRTL
ncbi:MAG: hypothetical protein WD904_10835 [Dehalococcoidia bacterium]